jgi:hypothetical protein
MTSSVIPARPRKNISALPDAAEFLPKAGLLPDISRLEGRAMSMMIAKPISIKPTRTRGAVSDARAA